jgi:hypothetical protein
MIQNAIDNPKLRAETFKMRFLAAGVVEYDNERALIKSENLMKIAQKFNGAKIIIDHKDVDETNAGEEIIGYASNIRLEGDGWAWCDFTVNSQEAIDLINNGFKPSCGYLPMATGSGGTRNNVPYDREIIDIEEDDTVTHIAIVETPRYEEAVILKNSINKINPIKNNIMNIFKLKKEVKENAAKEHELESLANSVFEMEDGEQIPLSSMMDVYKNAKEEEKEKENECEDKKVKINADDEFEVDGEMIKVSEMVKSYKSSKKNAEEEEEKKNAEDEAKEEEEKKNAEEEVEKEKEEKKEAKKNSVDAEKISKAKAKFENGVASDTTSSSYTSDSERFSLGESAYGEPLKASQ